MKKRTLKEELERIHSITYGKKVLLEDDLITKLIQGGDPNAIKPIDDPTKADYVDNDVAKFLTDLRSIKQPVSQQKLGSMQHQKEVETVQIALVLLGYELPRFGIDGLFGPETAEAVRKYKTDNNIISEGVIPGIDEMVWNKMPWGIDAGNKHNGLKWSGHNTHIHFGFTNVDVAVKVIEKALSLGLHAGENPYTSKVNPVHVDDSFHYNTFSQTVNGKKVGGGLDVSGNPSKMEELFNWVSTEIGGGDSVTMDSELDTDTEKSTIETVTPEMAQSMASKLELKGVTKEQLNQLIDKVTTGGGDIFTDLDLTTEEGYNMYSKICDLFIKTRKSNLLSITGDMMASSAKRTFEKYNKYVPPELALGQLAAEGGVGNSAPTNIAIKTKNPMNVGNMDDGSKINHSSVQSGIDSYYNLIAKDYIGKGRTAQDLINKFVNHEEKRYARSPNYEKVVGSIAREVNKIAKNLGINS
jgi:peptidoglycan hydrolase-like protein with peptidoglycan-binding domain